MTDAGPNVRANLFHSETGGGVFLCMVNCKYPLIINFEYRLQLTYFHLLTGFIWEVYGSVLESFLVD